MYASTSHYYAHLILALGIVRKPTVWGFITLKYPGIHDIGLPTLNAKRPYYVVLYMQGCTWTTWHDMMLGRPMSCVPGYFEVINTHTVGFLTIPRACIKWV